MLTPALAAAPEPSQCQIRKADGTWTGATAEMASTGFEPGHGEQGELLLLCPCSFPAVSCPLHMALLPCPHPPSPLQCPVPSTAMPQSLLGFQSSPTPMALPRVTCPLQSPFVDISAVRQKSSPYQSALRARDAPAPARWALSGKSRRNQARTG